ncbi:pantetheine-phosphate adenylyltransferase [Parvularcula sp. LCG005]|uniref:pantetheine-phosphate adenylyltransferase n=1 Tax=Parvularcula sp. LCG005 TaxID=3078805 RepID=UPI0029427D6C|nr:pantetheine-phosphate adenylyltransferase [Parvularcula sp. LCG005]WOI54705.1 pantetheine-phosphate adenylyltransferase [Parvularcula sp. LCG005]
MTKIVGLYPGTFDPITKGHTDIIRRAAKLVDHLVIGVAINEQKRPLFSLDERVDMIKDAVAEFDEGARAAVTVEPFDDLLMSFAEKKGVTMIIRGLRAVSDFEYEFQMVGMNSFLNDEIETVFLMADPQYQAIASKLVKEIARLGGKIDDFLPPSVVPKLIAKYS